MQEKILALNDWLIRNKLLKEAQQITFLLKTADAAGNIVGTFGYPRVIAEILWKRFGKNSFIVAKWLKEYNTRSYKYEEPDSWIDRIGGQSSSFSRDGSMTILLKLYNSTTDTETYRKMRRELDLWDGEPVFNEDLEIKRRIIKSEIEEDICKNMLFYFSLFSKILSGEVTDLRPYKDLSHQEALVKYEERNLFKDQVPIRTYDNGWSWIDAGKKCSILGKAMSNCGSSGVMSDDPDRTMMALFDKNNNPHVMVTYSPNQKRISGDVGRGESMVKDIYHQYIIDLADFLDSKFDSDKSPSKELGIKWDFRKYLKDWEIEYKSTFTSIFKMAFNDGSIYYTDTFYFLTDYDYGIAITYLAGLSNEERLEQGLTESNEIEAVFNHHNRDILSKNLGIKYITKYLFLKDLQN
jgi:hypothetical protein